MVRRTYKTTRMAILISVIVLHFIFVAWVTGGFKNWNVTSWFNYWGAGASEQIVPEQKDATSETSAMVLTSADDSSTDKSFTFDSEVSTLTTDVYNFKAPQIRMSEDQSKIEFNYYDPNYTVEIPNLSKVRYQVDLITWNFRAFGSPPVPVTYKTDYFQSFWGYLGGFLRSGTISITFDDLEDFISEQFKNKEKPLCFDVRVKVLGNDNFLDSSESSLGIYINRDKKWTLDGVLLTIPKPELPSSLPYKPATYSGSDEHFRPSLNVRVGDDLSGWDNNLLLESGYNRDLVTEDDENLYIHLNRFSRFNILGQYRLLTAYKLTHSDPSYSAPFYSLPAGDCYIFMSTPLPNFNFEVSLLPEPTNIKLNVNVLSWDEVPGNNGYYVSYSKDGGSETSLTVKNTSYKFSLDAGNYTFRIRALGNLGSALAQSSSETVLLSAYNASTVITQLVIINLNVDGDIITKLVPYGSIFSDYLYEVNIPNKEFGGWFYDTGFSSAVNSTDIINRDITIYARLSDVKVTERPLTWWELHRWQVIIPAIVFCVVLGVFTLFVFLRKKVRG